MNYWMIDYKDFKPDIREKTLEYGISFPTDEELIMLILGTGSKDIPVNVMARKIVRALDDSNSENRIQKLMKVKGVGKGKALAVAAAMELGKRRSGFFKAKIQHPEDIIPYVKNYSICDREHFLSITLNGNHEIINIHVVTVGIVNKTLVHAREIFADAIRENSSALILCHNHPSGNCMPSPDDVETTQGLVEASEIMGIRILDHIIIGPDNHFSFMENRLVFVEEKAS